jgi:hypothetical protein
MIPQPLVFKQPKRNERNERLKQATNEELYHQAESHDNLLQ